MSKPTVYFAMVENTGRVKIGCSSNVYKRVKTLQTGCPDKIKVIFVFPQGGRYLEKTLHKKFSKSRILGEWFQYDPNIREFIEQKRDEIRERREEKEHEAYERKMQEEHDLHLEEEYERYQELEYQKYMQSQGETDAEEDC